MNNKTNIRLILSLLAALVAVASFGFGSYYINGLTEKTSTLQGENETKEIKIKRIQNLNASAEKTNLDREKLKNYFVHADKAIDFVTVLESVASGLGLQYSTNSIENIEEDNLAAQNKQLLRISMSLSGGWKNILTYILYIESLPYALSIEKMEMVSEGVVTTSAQTSSQTNTNEISGGSSIKSILPKSSPESKWRLGVTFSVVKEKDKR